MQNEFKVGNIVEYLPTAERGIIKKVMPGNIIVEFEPSINNPYAKEIRIINYDEFSKLFRLFKNISVSASYKYVTPEQFYEENIDLFKESESPEAIEAEIEKTTEEVAKSAYGRIFEPTLNLYYKLEPIYKKFYQKIEEITDDLPAGIEKSSLLKSIESGEKLPENIILDFKYNKLVFYDKDKLKPILDELVSSIHTLPWDLSAKLSNYVTEYTIPHVREKVEGILDQLKNLEKFMDEGHNLINLAKPSDIVSLLYNTLQRLKGFGIAWDLKRGTEGSTISPEKRRKWLLEEYELTKEDIKKQRQKAKEEEKKRELQKKIDRLQDKINMLWYK